jgi:DNA-binding CsgD family transcriptional regulator
MSHACNTFGVGTGPDARHLELLERAVSIALSPLEFANSAAWAQALTTELCAIADATSGAFLLPDAANRWRSVNVGAALLSDDVPDRATRAHEEATERLFDPGGADAVLWVRDDLSEGDAALTTPWAASTIGIRVRTPKGAVAVVYVRRDPALGRVPSHVVAALRAVAPAFRAGISACDCSTASRLGVAHMLDTLVDPALLFSASGELLHINRAADRLTRSADAARLRTEAQRIAFGVGATARRKLQTARSSSASTETTTIRTVRIGETVYQLRGSVVGEQLFAAEPAVLVTVALWQSEPLSDDTLHARYGLTVREIQVARLVAAGLSNNEIADRLGVRFFTARNHVERTLAKLGVASRHRVGPLLRNEASAEIGLTSAA